ncbi:MAG: DJ-1/PfpI family protein [Burkholderiales bacterium]|nr:DJ-1/PfpI family protein [Burkholderiales bacterium]
MRIAILTFEGFNEIDSLLAYSLLNRLKSQGWTAEIVSDREEVTSMNGLTIKAHQSLSVLPEMDVVWFGSGTRTRDVAADAELMSRLKVDPSRQLIAAQCSGTLLLAKLGLLGEVPACTDLTTKPWVVEAGAKVIDAPIFARDSIATAGGCMASVYLATWLICRQLGEEAAARVLHYVAPVGEKEAYIAHALAVVRPHVIRAAVPVA